MALLGYDTHENALRDIGWLTLREYQLRIEAYQVKQVHRREDIARQAWDNQQVQATTGSGKNIKSKWKNFKAFFDLDAELDAVLTTRTKRQSTDLAVVQARLKRMQEFNALKKAGKIVPWKQRQKGGKT